MDPSKKGYTIISQMDLSKRSIYLFLKVVLQKEG
jgi:hypothetical protein